MTLKDITPIMTSNNAPTPYVVSASSNWQTNYPYKAFDNNDSTYWHSEGNPTNSWISIDCGSVITMDYLSITSRADWADGYKQAPKNFIVRCSEDNKTWVEILIRTNETSWGLKETRFYKLDLNTRFRYCKILFQADNGEGNIVISSIKFYRMANTPVSNTNAFYAQTLPMNTTRNILNKRDDFREGLLGMANDQENYGDLYIINSRGTSQLAKAGIKTEVVWEGVANAVGDYTLSTSLNRFKYVIISHECESPKSLIYYHHSQIVDFRAKGFETTTGSDFIIILANNTVKPTDFSTPRIAFSFTSDRTFTITYYNLAGSLYNSVYVNKIVGVY